MILPSVILFLPKILVAWEYNTTLTRTQKILDKYDLADLFYSLFLPAKNDLTPSFDFPLTKTWGVHEFVHFSLVHWWLIIFLIIGVYKKVIPFKKSSLSLKIGIITSLISIFLFFGDHGNLSLFGLINNIFLAFFQTYSKFKI
jgi:hypothetical protein